MRKVNFINGNNNIRKIFFCGIGGASMSGMAMMLASLGYFIMGSDACPRDDIIKLCRENKVPLFFSHSAENVKGCDLVIYSSAIKADNCELLEAKRLGIPTIKRSVALGAITDSFSHSVAIAGTHGKSTVTSMVYEAMVACGKKPFLLCGATLKSLNVSYALGNEDTIIYEACEYDRSFLDFHPSTAVILNIEREHTDTYPTLADAEEAYFEFALKSKTIILNYDCAPCQALGRRLLAMGKSIRFFSLHRTRGALFGENLTDQNGLYTFDIIHRGKQLLNEVSLSVYGKHNVANALAATLTCLSLGINDYEKIKQGISSFSGIKRRFEFIGKYNGADVYDDYAHHPTEIKATLGAASRLGYQKIICVFQPHTYSRTKAFFKEFCECFKDCDEVVIAPIYGAREQWDGKNYALELALSIPKGKFIAKKSEILEYLSIASHPQTMILTMGAGEMDSVSRALVDMGKENM